jgi:hypothetical protein
MYDAPSKRERNTATTVAVIFSRVSQDVVHVRVAAVGVLVARTDLCRSAVTCHSA